MQGVSDAVLSFEVDWTATHRGEKPLVLNLHAHNGRLEVVVLNGRGPIASLTVDRDAIVLATKGEKIVRSMASVRNEVDDGADYE